METDGPRRSTRARKPVKSYAVDQAEDTTKSSRAAKGKRKKAEDDDDGDVEALEPTKKAKKKSKASKQSAEDADDEFKGQVEKASSSKPKRANTSNTWHLDAAETRIEANKRKVKRLASGQAETRLRPYVDDPPQSYHNALKRATKERMFVLERERSVEEDCHANHPDCPCEEIQLAGSTGNVYKVTISHLPTCNCPAGVFTRKGEEKACKHVLYVLHNVLKVPNHLKHQNAFLTSELKEIFSNAPALPSQVAEDEPMDGNRKSVEDDCPICCNEFEEDEDIVWCRAACGNNIHKACFDQWAKMKAGRVTCPFCRSEWEYDAPKTQKVNVASVSMPEERGAGGYRNVRDQLDYD